MAPNKSARGSSGTLEKHPTLYDPGSINFKTVHAVTVNTRIGINDILANDSNTMLVLLFKANKC